MGVYKVKNTYHIADFYKVIAQQHPLQYDHQFIVQFIAPQGQTGTLLAGDDAFGRRDSSYQDCFTYWVQSAEVPNLTIKQATIKFLANDFQVPGVIQYGDSWNVKVLLDQDLTQYKKLQAWHKLISDFSKSGGGKKVIPNVQAKVCLLDNTMQNIQHIYIMQGVWLSQLGQVGFEYSNGGNALADCTAKFIYQYFYPADDLESPTASDPLSPGVVDAIANLQKLHLG